MMIGASDCLPRWVARPQFRGDVLESVQLAPLNIFNFDYSPKKSRPDFQNQIRAKKCPTLNCMCLSNGTKSKV